MRSKALVGERGVECLVIGEIDLHSKVKRSPAARVGDTGQPVAFQLRIVIIVDAVDPDHMIAARQ